MNDLTDCCLRIELPAALRNAKYTFDVQKFCFLLYISIEQNPNNELENSVQRNIVIYASDSLTYLLSQSLRLREVNPSSTGRSFLGQVSKVYTFLTMDGNDTNHLLMTSPNIEMNNTHVDVVDPVQAHQLSRKWSRIFRERVRIYSINADAWDLELLTTLLVITAMLV